MVIFGGVPSDQLKQPTGREGWLAMEFRRGTQSTARGGDKLGVYFYVYFTPLSAPNGRVKTDTCGGNAMETAPDIQKMCRV